MPFVEFRTRCPDLAMRETRVVTVLREDNDQGLPPGEYGFLEMFCDEPGCDCRRALFKVFGVERRRMEAMIGYGWESREFYASWLGSEDEDDPMLDAMVGATLHLGPAQGPFADGLLTLCRDVLLEDAAFVARVKRHYEVFRESVEADHDPTVRGVEKPGRNDPCPCGSGRKFKKCCWQN